MDFVGHTQRDQCKRLKELFYFGKKKKLQCMERPVLLSFFTSTFFLRGDPVCHIVPLRVIPFRSQGHARNNLTLCSFCCLDKMSNRFTFQGIHGILMMLTRLWCLYMGVRYKICQSDVKLSVFPPDKMLYENKSSQLISSEISHNS